MLPVPIPEVPPRPAIWARSDVDRVVPNSSQQARAVASASWEPLPRPRWAGKCSRTVIETLPPARSAASTFFAHSRNQCRGPAVTAADFEGRACLRLEKDRGVVKRDPYPSVDPSKAAIHIEQRNMDTRWCSYNHPVLVEELAVRELLFNEDERLAAVDNPVPGERAAARFYRWRRSCTCHLLPGLPER